MAVKPAARALARIDVLLEHPQAEQLIEIVTGETDVSSAGFPYISDRSFRILTDQVPHLFREGAAIIDWLATLEEKLGLLSEIPAPDRASIDRAVAVLRTVIYTAGVTAPPDLWILKHVLSAHRELDILDWLLAGHPLDPEAYARQNGLNERQLNTDLHFLHSRGYLREGDGDFVAPAEAAIVDILRHALVVPTEFRRNLVPELTRWISTPGATDPTLLAWLWVPEEHHPTGNWVASQFEIELGYRLLPVVLSLRVLGITPRLRQGARLADHIPNLAPELNRLLELSGYSRGGEVGELGARVFERGPGAFGIIAAYHPYLNQLPELLRSGAWSTWVHRGENVAASQDANRKTFSIANDKLDQFCADYGYRYRVFIEHAVGRGEAIRQRFEQDGEAAVRYFGADLEDAAIDQALVQQQLGVLPANLQFIRSADIGEPHKVIDYLTGLGLASEPTVMMVGNGFHEIRDQTNEEMVNVFRQYAQAGYLLIFTEESALHDEALLNTAWNTYHAGFRYVHEMSGQGLRPAFDGETAGGRWSWRRCAELGGYVVLDEYSYRGRTIYPYRRPRGKNPSISVTYFCVPSALARQMAIKPDQGRPGLQEDP